MIKRGVFLFAILAFAAAAASSVPQTPGHPDFTGSWVFNAARSKMQIPPPDSAVFTIDHKEPLFKLSRTLVTKGQADTWGIDLTTDGKEVTQKNPGETTTGHLTWDGRELVFDSTIVLGTRKASNIVRYSLSADGSVLTAVEKFRGPVVKYDNIWVFDRKK
jgi:hypothetical protein